LSCIRGASQLGFFCGIPARTRSILVQKNQVHPTGLCTQKIEQLPKMAKFCQLWFRGECFTPKTWSFIFRTFCRCSAPGIAWGRHLCMYGWCVMC
jgi:hypothetical protein